MNAIKVTPTFWTTFGELTDEQKREYFDDNYEKFEPFECWHEYTIDYYVELLEAIGFDCVEVYFSGFCSQGDGAKFVGHYSVPVTTRHKITAFKAAQQNKHIKRLYRQLNSIDFDDSLYFSILNSGHYQHELCTTFDFDDYYYYKTEKSISSLPDDLEEHIKTECRYVMQEIYSDLEKEYEYLTNIENIIADGSFDDMDIQTDDKGKPL